MVSSAFEGNSKVNSDSNGAVTVIISLVSFKPNTGHRKEAGNKARLTDKP